MEKAYAPDVVAAARRVARIFDDGCDRCNRDDLLLLEQSGLMDRTVCEETFGQDTLEVGETMWVFNAAGRQLIAAMPN